MLSGQPILILREGTSRETGKRALKKNIAAARAVSDAVRSTLGPKGMDKMLVDTIGDVVITNDGVTILKEIEVLHPAAKMVVEVAKTLDDECGDGTTSAVIVAGELLKLAEALLDQGVHPTAITSGYKMASDKTLAILREVSLSVTGKDVQLLKNVAMTAMTGKAAGVAKEHLAELAVEAVLAVVEERHGIRRADVRNIKVEKKQGGSVSDSSMIDGIMVDNKPVHQSMPREFRNARIALIGSALEVKKTEVEAKIQITSPAQLQAFLDEEERMLRLKAERIIDQKVNVVICHKGIDDFVQFHLAKAGVMALEKTKETDMKMLARATGGGLVMSVDDLSEEDLGRAGSVSVKKISDDEITFISGCEHAKAVSILIRGGSDHVVTEIERAFDDALSVVSVVVEDGHAVAGGGASETEVALRLREYAATIGGREQLAIEAFAQAQEIIPRTLAENAGVDPMDILVNIRSAHEGRGGNRNAGLNSFTGRIEDMVQENVLEALRVKIQGITSATEVANMILRIDDVIAARDSRSAHGSTGGPGGHYDDPGDMDY